MTRHPIQAALAVVLLLLMLPLAACPGNGYKNPDAPSSPNK